MSLPLHSSNIHVRSTIHITPSAQHLRRSLVKNSRYDMQRELSFQRQSTPARPSATTLKFHDKWLTLLLLTFADDVLALVPCLYQRVAHSPTTKQSTKWLDSQLPLQYNRQLQNESTDCTASCFTIPCFCHFPPDGSIYHTLAMMHSFR